MQLKKTGSGEVTSWLAEMAVTAGATTWDRKYLSAIIDDKVHVFEYTSHCRKGFTHMPQCIRKNYLHCTMSCVLSEELASTPLEAVQVIMVKALSLVTRVASK